MPVSLLVHAVTHCLHDLAPPLLAIFLFLSVVSDSSVVLLVTTPVGAGIGAAVRAALPAGSVTVYRAGTAPRR